MIAAEPPKRLRSLDVFRGIAIAAMVLVNNPGSWEHVYPPLLHAEWHGCTPTDLVFPFFLFIVGSAMAYSLARFENTRPTRSDYLRLLRRAAVLFGLGLLLNGFPLYDLSTIRVLGVLQRIALAYLLASAIVLALPRWLQEIMAVNLLIIHTALLAWVPVPGGAAGDLSPAGNLGAWLDRLVLGQAHLYAGGPYDPEGLLGTLSAAATVLIGYFAGMWLKRRKIEIATSFALARTGIFFVGAGWLWDLIFPINKALWTAPYVIFTAGWSLLLLAACYELVEVRGMRWLGWPFEVLGLNAIFLFVASGLVGRLLRKVIFIEGQPAGSWLYAHLFAPWAGSTNGSLAYALVTVLLWWLVLYGMYQRRWLLKV